MIFSVSARSKKSDEPLLYFLSTRYPEIPIDSINSVYGFAEPCTMYGGRLYLHRELSDNDIQWLYDNNKNLKIPLSNASIYYPEYKKQKNFLKKYHKKGNILTIVDDSIVPLIKHDFPDYTIEASAIKNIYSNEEVIQARKIYDTIVLPIKANDNVELLNSIEEKSCITLFGNSGCGYNCPDPICYSYVSKAMKGVVSDTPHCSLSLYPRKVILKTYDLNKLSELGFSKFKLMNLKFH
jgi:hypothetical protein